MKFNKVTSVTRSNGKVIALQVTFLEDIQIGSDKHKIVKQQSGTMHLHLGSDGLFHSKKRDAFGVLQPNGSYKLSELPSIPA